MVAAARITDPITHTGSLTGMLLGIAAGVVVGAALVAAEVVTGGLATVAIVGLCAATGGGVGAFAGSLSWATSVVGSIVGPGSPNVLINFLPAARAHIDMVLCSQHCPPPVPIAQGSDNVFINYMPAARVHDMSACSGLIGKGSPNVFIGGGTKTTDAISPEIPKWLSYTVLAVGVVSAAVLFGPVTAVLGLVGGYVGGEVGGAIGGALFGEGSDGQKWLAFGGSMVGGIMTGGMGAAADDALGSEGLLLRGGEPPVNTGEPTAPLTSPEGVEPPTARPLDATPSAPTEEPPVAPGSGTEEPPAGIGHNEPPADPPQDPPGTTRDANGRLRGPDGRYVRDPNAPVDRYSRDTEYPSSYRQGTHDEMTKNWTEEGLEQGQSPVDADGNRIPREQLNWLDEEGNPIPYYDENGNTNLTYDHDPPVVEHWNEGGGKNMDQAGRNDYYNDPGNLKPMGRSQNSSDGARIGKTYDQNPGPNYSK